MLVEQQSNMRLAQLKILGGQTETGGDGLCRLTIVIRRCGLVRPAEESQRKIVVCFCVLGVGRDLLPGGGDSLLSRSGLLASVAQQRLTRR